MIQIQLMCYYALCHGITGPLLMGPLLSLLLVLNHLYNIAWKERLTLMASTSILILHPKKRSKHVLKIIIIK